MVDWFYFKSSVFPNTVIKVYLGIHKCGFKSLPLKNMFRRYELIS
jgi:hypothetical protein